MTDTPTIPTYIPCQCGHPIRFSASRYGRKANVICTKCGASLYRLERGGVILCCLTDGKVVEIRGGT